MVINPILADLNLADAHPDDNWEYPGSVTWADNHRGATSNEFWWWSPYELVDMRVFASPALVEKTWTILPSGGETPVVVDRDTYPGHVDLRCKRIDGWVGFRFPHAIPWVVERVLIALPTNLPQV
jgi:hypothetical protein